MQLGALGYGIWVHREKAKENPSESERALDSSVVATHQA